VRLRVGDRGRRQRADRQRVELGGRLAALRGPGDDLAGQRVRSLRYGDLDAVGRQRDQARPLWPDDGEHGAAHAGTGRPRPGGEGAGTAAAAGEASCQETASRQERQKARGFCGLAHCTLITPFPVFAAATTVTVVVALLPELLSVTVIVAVPLAAPVTTPEAF